MLITDSRGIKARWTEEYTTPFNWADVEKQSFPQNLGGCATQNGSAKRGTRLRHWSPLTLTQVLSPQGEMYVPSSLHPGAKIFTKINRPKRQLLSRWW